MIDAISKLTGWMHARGRRLVRSSACVAVLALAAAMCIRPQASRAAPVAKAAPPHPVAARSVVSRNKPTNPHLHTVQRAPAKPASKTVHVARKPSVAVHARPPGRSPRRHVATHAHRPGTITGVVHGSKGGAVAGAKVVLKRPGGHTIRNARARHTTYTSAAGAFSMRAVKAGRYRVVAAKTGAGRGRAGAAVRSGGMQRVAIKLAGATPRAADAKVKRRK
ncbi:MAG TPA: carboxypeptidase-like regulatory domain-containing protein [Tepidisphaeraceae bacterium]